MFKSIAQSIRRCFSKPHVRRGRQLFSQTESVESRIVLTELLTGQLVRQPGIGQALGSVFQQLTDPNNLVLYHAVPIGQDLRNSPDI